MVDVFVGAIDVVVDVVVVEVVDVVVVVVDVVVDVVGMAFPMCLSFNGCGGLKLSTSGSPWLSSRPRKALSTLDGMPIVCLKTTHVTTSLQSGVVNEPLYV